jgi:hypothetical protein
MSHSLTRPRIPHEIILVCGGWSGGSPTSAVELYDVGNRYCLSTHVDLARYLKARADKWFQLPFIDKCTVEYDRRTRT